MCNGGLGVAALAIADEEKTKAETVLDYVAKNMPVVMKLYAPDGGFAEGLTYWSYGTRYNVILLAAAKTAMDTDYGLTQQPGFSRTGQYRIHMISPINNSGVSFNYGDQNEPVGGAPMMLWLASQFTPPFYARAELDRKGAGGRWGLLWYDPKFAAPTANNVPLNAVYHGIEVASFRSAWNDPKAFFAGFKGGDNDGGHSHLDIGSFVLDAQGERWGMDLGIEAETYKFANASKRYTYYRIKAEGHNTLTISENTQQALSFSNQHTEGKSLITRFEGTGAAPFAIANLTDAYRPEVAGDNRAIDRGVRVALTVGSAENAGAHFGSLRIEPTTGKTKK